MALAFTTTIRDQVALLLTGRTYTQCTPADQTAIAGTDGAGDRALSKIQQWAHFVELAGSDTAPDAWSRWLTREAAYEACVFIKPEREDDLRRHALLAQREALQTFTRSEVDGTTSVGDLAGDVGAIRRHIISRCVRMEPLVLPEPDVIDSAIKQMITRVWNDADWKFTQRLGVFTIAADGSVTVADEAGDPLVIDKIVGDCLRYDSGRGQIVSVGRDYILRHRSQETVVTGRPAYFHLQKAGSDILWLFAPKPDAEYVARAMVRLKTPAMTTIAGINAALLLIPHEVVSLMHDLCLGKVLYDLGRGEGQALMMETIQEMGGLIPSYDNPGGEIERSDRGDVRPRGLGVHLPYLGGHV